MPAEYLSSVNGQTDAGTLTVGAGSDRLLIVFSTGEGGNRPLTGITWGGVAVGQAGPTSQTDKSQFISTWIILESEIAANNGGVFDMSWGTAPSGARRHVVTLQGAAQSYTLSDSDAFGTAGATSGSTTVTVPSGGAAVACGLTDWDAGAAFTWTNATELFENSHSSSSARSTCAYLQGSSGDQTISLAWTDSVGAAILSLAVAPSGVTASTPRLLLLGVG